MEIFAGAAVLTSMAVSRSLPVSAPVDIKLDGSDLLKPSVRASIEKEIEMNDPYILTFGPKCDHGDLGPISTCPRVMRHKTRS